MVNRQFAIETDLPIDECLRRLDDNLAKGLFSQFSSKALFGRISKNNILLQKRIAYTNSFQYVYSGKIFSEDNKTVLLGITKTSTFVKVFILVWVLFLLFLTFIDVLVQQKKMAAMKLLSFEMVQELSIPLFLLIFGIAIYNFGKYIAREEPRFIFEFLLELLNGNLIEPGSPKMKKLLKGKTP